MMKTFVKKLLGLNISDEEQKILNVLNTSSVTRTVSKRGTIYLNVVELVATDKFKNYQKQASDIVKG